MRFTFGSALGRSQRSQAIIDDVAREHLEEWQLLFDGSYGKTGNDYPADVNFSGWGSSYSGGPIPQEQMVEWVEETAARVRSAVVPKARVLELGCGTGLLLFRLAPDAVSYVATDFSPVVLDQLGKSLAGQPWADRVRLLQREASDFTSFGDGAFDVVVLNSVVQYFPDRSYLEHVLEQAVRVLAPGGVVVVGDVRHRGLLSAFHASVQAYQGAGTVGELARRIRRRVGEEPELVIDPAFFTDLADRWDRVDHVRVLPKRGRFANEMVKFRYEAFLHVESETEPLPIPAWTDWADGSLTLDGLAGRLAGGPGEPFGVTGVPNARVEADVRLRDLALSGEAPAETQVTGTGLLVERPVPTGGGEGAVDPEALCRLAEESGHQAQLSWAAGDGSGRFDVAFLPPGAGVGPGTAISFPSGSGGGTNEPLRSRGEMF
ncbi:class I SAM-dependent methyltransferase [Nocardiopsis sp. CT-R113]|uniref:Class I SAM-dependent methyltransferase n=1 Tax=Nocardiopsis codii TaxID=3065942 RepID=A0ABU7K678_9ACTN|nr:class I SAM-dependent methyltransferase [Nocardiopsis sp. CT-R113]MEE2037537.1 class I SAM-dependent methyltransferase [Nocardiopsis sp. CT-R113]